MSKLVDELIREGYLRTENIIDAFLSVPRENFVPKDLFLRAESNIPLPIGSGQTISQPLTVAFMFELLNPLRGQHILDIGSGSGWTTGLLAYVVGEKGHVTAVELLLDLCKKGKENILKFDFIQKGIVEFYCQSGDQGFEKNAPYDRILVSASAKKIPENLKSQLSIGGKMVIPIKDEIWCVEKVAENDFKIEKFPGFSFVPFIN